MSILIDDPKTASHPRVSSFLEVCRTLHPDLVMRIEDLAKPALVPYAENLILAQWKDDKDDFLYRMSGNAFIEYYGLELTGKYVSEGEFKEYDNMFRTAYQTAMNEKRPYFLSGRIVWREREHRAWSQVVLPLMRGDKVTDALSMVHFEVDTP